MGHRTRFVDKFDGAGLIEHAPHCQTTNQSPHTTVAHKTNRVSTLQKILLEERPFRALTGTTQVVNIIGGGVSKSNALSEQAAAVLHEHDNRARRRARAPPRCALQPPRHSVRRATPARGRAHVRRARDDRARAGHAHHSAAAPPARGHDPRGIRVRCYRRRASADPGPAIVTDTDTRKADEGLFVLHGVMVGNDTGHTWALSRHIFQYAHNLLDLCDLNGMHTVNERIRADAFFIALILNVDERRSLAGITRCSTRDSECASGAPPNIPRKHAANQDNRLKGCDCLQEIQRNLHGQGTAAAGKATPSTGSRVCAAGAWMATLSMGARVRVWTAGMAPASVSMGTVPAECACACAATGASHVGSPCKWAARTMAAMEEAPRALTAGSAHYSTGVRSGAPRAAVASTSAHVGGSSASLKVPGRWDACADGEYAECSCAECCGDCDDEHGGGSRARTAVGTAMASARARKAMACVRAQGYVGRGCTRVYADCRGDAAPSACARIIGRARGQTAGVRSRARAGVPLVVCGEWRRPWDKRHYAPPKKDEHCVACE
ncbi:hypothetical protein GGX14DRAFT_662360 [Mycena pura]|uniref:Uncharacterized protein n=1 Tax=Mycena pura TaxID=153505 RepID=A0AAD6V0P8_9AGAR|nr:hypothetical protein GGX14DRAFT_662360 [Mycena pura]